MEIRQTYNILDNNGEQVYFFAIISKLANYFSTNVLSWKRIVENKEFFSFIVMSASKSSLIKTSDYFNKYPLLSSKFLDYKSWLYILELQKNKKETISYLDEAINIRQKFNLIKLEQLILGNICRQIVMSTQK